MIVTSVKSTQSPTTWPWSRAWFLNGPPPERTKSLLGYASGARYRDCLFFFFFFVTFFTLFSEFFFLFSSQLFFLLRVPRGARWRLLIDFAHAHYRRCWRKKKYIAVRPSGPRKSRRCVVMRYNNLLLSLSRHKIAIRTWTRNVSFEWIRCIMTIAENELQMRLHFSTKTRTNAFS